MKCLRCQTEMKQYIVSGDLELFGKETNKKYEIGTTIQDIIKHQSAYVCNNCGCIELRKTPCDL